MSPPTRSSTQIPFNNDVGQAFAQIMMTIIEELEREFRRITNDPSFPDNEELRRRASYVWELGKHSTVSLFSNQ